MIHSTIWEQVFFSCELIMHQNVNVWLIARDYCILTIKKPDSFYSRSSNKCSFLELVCLKINIKFQACYCNVATIFLNKLPGKNQSSVMNCYEKRIGFFFKDFVNRFHSHMLKVRMSNFSYPQKNHNFFNDFWNKEVI